MIVLTLAVMCGATLIAWRIDVASGRIANAIADRSRDGGNNEDWFRPEDESGGAEGNRP